MTNTKVEGIIDTLQVKAAAAIPQKEGDYINSADGLLYCGKCHTPKETRVNFSDQERKVRCVCECEQQRERQKQENDERKRRALLIDKMRTRAFKDKKGRNSTFDKADRNNAEASRFFANYAELFNQNSKWLFISGNCGTGKSFFAACICNRVIDKEYSAKFTTIAAIARELLKTTDKEAIYDELSGCDLLVLDDLTSERNTDYIREIIFNVIDARSRSEKPLIITSNITPTELSNPSDIATERIYSRIYENSIIYKLVGSDRRREKLKQNMKEIDSIMNYSGLSAAGKE